MTDIKTITAPFIKKCCSHFSRGNVYLRLLLLTTLFFALSSSGFGQDKKGDPSQSSSSANQQVVHDNHNKCNFYVSCPYKTYLGAFECYYIPSKPYTRDDLLSWVLK